MNATSKPCLIPLACASLCLIVHTARAQNDSVTISAAEFQQLVYSSHLLTQLDEKPELDAALHVLLEMQRRNPHGDPVALAGVVTEATADYRTNASVHLLNRGFRDEILATYLESLRRVPERTNFVSANLSLLNCFLLQPTDYATASAAELIHAGDQRLLTIEETVAQRETLVKLCVQRGFEKPAFAVAMDSLLWPETGALLSHTPAEILSVNAFLSNSPTMQLFLARSTSSGDGSVTVSTNELKSLFIQEMDVMHEVIETNRVVHLEILETKTDLTSYLTNTALIDANAQREAAMKLGQAQRFAAAHAAVMATGDLTAKKSPLLSKHMINVGRSVKGIFDGVKSWNEGGSLMKGLACGNFVAAGLGLVGVFLDISGPTPEQMILDELADIKGMINDLSTNMNYRFDQVDKSLNQLGEDLDEVLDQLAYSINKIGEVGHDVNEVRRDLRDVQENLHRLERHVLSYVNQLYARGLNLDFNYYLGHEATYGDPMSSSDYDLTEANFFTHARNSSVDGLSSPYTDRVYTPEGLYTELTESGNGTTNRLDQNLSYIKQYLLSPLDQGTGGPLPLANPRDWFVGAAAYLQLAAENPIYYRNVSISNRLDLLIARGRELTNFLSSLTFSGTNINWPLLNAVLNHHVDELTDFTSQVHTTEQQHASSYGFDLDTWRQWSADAPRFTVEATKVLVSPAALLPPIPRDATNIAAGGYHSLAVRNDGTVVGWGDNSHGQILLPSEATNLVAIAAGLWHSLALRSDGVPFGAGAGGPGTSGGDHYGQTTIPADATNVIAVSAGHFHSLALRADGRVIAWGAGTNSTSFPHYGQSDVPPDATNITAIAAGGYHSLALRADRTLLAWGLNNEGQLNIPETATNVMAIAAGHGHNLVLKSNGTLVAWGNNLYGSTNIPPEATNIIAIAASGWHCLAQRDDGKVFSWGWNNYGQTIVPDHLIHVRMLAAGRFHSLALKTDGTVDGWGWNNRRQCLIPPTLTWEGALSADWMHFFALRPDGTIVDYGVEPDYGNSRPSVPANVTNVVAVAAGNSQSLVLQADGNIITWRGGTLKPASATNVVAVASGGDHNLALKDDGTIVGWGRNNYGQVTGVPYTNSPYSSTGLVMVAGETLSNVVAIAASQRHSLALRGDGTVVGWGYNNSGQATGVATTNSPYSSAGTVVLAGHTLSNVVALAAGDSHSLALQGDGKVVGWGSNYYGQTDPPSHVTNIVAIAAGDSHSLALRADGTVVAWGSHWAGQTNIPPNVTNTVAIGAGGDYCVALQADGSVLAWGEWFTGHTAIPGAGTNVVAVAAGQSHNLALRADGAVLGWGEDYHGMANGAAAGSNVVAISAGQRHSLALHTNGTVTAWGDNYYGQTNAPATATNVVAISAGHLHNLALRHDGTVVGWGYNSQGQANGATAGTNVVAIAAGGYHNLALKADGSVAAWGANWYGQTDRPASAINVVAIAAGYNHSLALRADGTVVCWGRNNYGQTNAPASATNVVAIAAGYDHSLALRADGTVVCWGDGYHGQTIIPTGATNVIAMAGGGDHSLFLTATETPGPVGYGTPFVTRAHIPDRVGDLLREVNEEVYDQLTLNLHSNAVSVSGSKALLLAILELGMPYTMERDDLLHGYFYGSEPLIDLDASHSFLAAEMAKLHDRPDARLQSLTEVAILRYLRFSERLEARLNDLQATGQPELPRMVGHTLRLLGLLRDAWTRTPASTMEMRQEPDQVRLWLYGEPYAFYTLQESFNLDNWFDTGVTNLRSVDTPIGIINVLDTDAIDPEHYYRAKQSVP